jgi:hypothetical protein
MKAGTRYATYVQSLSVPDMVHPNRQGAKAFAEFLEVALHA